MILEFPDYVGQKKRERAVEKVSIGSIIWERWRDGLGRPPGPSVGNLLGTLISGAWRTGASQIPSKASGGADGGLHHVIVSRLGLVIAFVVGGIWSKKEKGKKEEEGTKGGGRGGG